MPSLINDTALYINAGSTRQVQAADAGATYLLDQLAGCTVTLPPAIGSGRKYRFSISVVPTSNSHIVKVQSATDFFIGGIMTMSDDPATVKAFWAANSGTVATNSDTITLNRTTTGGTQKNEWLEVEDIAAATWAVKGLTASTGTEATPFSAGV